MSRPFEENDLVLSLEDLQAAAEGAGGSSVPPPLDKPRGVWHHKHRKPGWRNGRRSGLKIRQWRHCGGSSPPPGTR